MILKTFIFHYWKTLFVIGCILFLSFTSPSTFKGIPTFENEDKLVHMLMFTGLTGILIFDFRRYAKKITTLRFVLICLAFPVFLGGAIEILQPLYFAPRTAEWFDWFSDITGVLLGWYAINLITRKLLKRYFN